MSILKVARMGHPVLRTKALPIPPAEIGSAAIQQLIDDMLDTMREYSGIGLAAPQVHQDLRVFVAGVRDIQVTSPMTDELDMPFIALINPEIMASTDKVVEGWEGCLSIPDIRGMVPRAKSVRVQAYDRQGERVEIRAHDFAARVIQHETDHLDGILFFDRMRAFETLTFLEEYSRYWVKGEDED